MYVIFLKLYKSVLDVIQSVYANEEIKYRNYNKQYGHRFEYATRAVSLYDIQSALRLEALFCTCELSCKFGASDGTNFVPLQVEQ